MKKYRFAHVVVAIALMSLISGCFGISSTAPGTYSVSGIVVDSDGNGIEDVTLAFFKGFGTAKTNSAGEWRKNGLRGTVKISPSKDGYVFAPSSCEVSVPSDSVYFTGSNSVAAKGRMKVSFVGNTEPGFSRG